MSAPIELHFAATPNGWKITIMLEECGLPYVIRPVDLSAGDQFKPDFLAISPNGRMPAIVDPDGPGGRPLAVFESGAILQYLGRKSGRFYPSDERARAGVEQWLFWQIGGLGPMQGQAAHFRNYIKQNIPYAIDRYVDEVKRLYGVMNRHLAARDHLGDDYSIADMACWPWVRGYKAVGVDLGAEFPNLQAWFRRVGGREAVRRGADIGRAQFAESQKRIASDRTGPLSQDARRHGKT